MGRALMVQGTASSAGKSLLVTALCALAARAGVRVAPFKAQNMSNNARVVDGGGGEIGTAQAVQAWAAGIEPDVRMNPVLVKPEGDTRSQVVRLGRVDPVLGRTPWTDRADAVWPDIRDSLHALLAEFDLVVIEGAGSPAEFNLWHCDVANMRVAVEADAPVVLVSDIDRGGALAHCYGTWALLPPDQRRRIRGFVLNRFRGDPTLLTPALAGLRDRTGVPVLGVLPWIDHGLPDEDAAGAWMPGAAGPPAAGPPVASGKARRGADLRPAPSRTGDVAVVTYPTISNLDEFAALARVVAVRWVRSPDEVGTPSLLVLPGSKHVAADLDWLRETGLADAVVAAADRGVPVLGICGGHQMLGERLVDPVGVDGSRRGLGVLPLETTFAATKLTRRTSTRFGALPATWSTWSHAEVDGYEIRHGRTRAVGPVTAALPDGCGHVRGNVLGVTVHGLFEQPDLVRRRFGVTPADPYTVGFDRLADAVATHLDPTALDDLLHPNGPRRERTNHGNHRPRPARAADRPTGAR